MDATAGSPWGPLAAEITKAGESRTCPAALTRAPKMLPLRSQATRKFEPSKVTAGTAASFAELDTRMPLGSRRAPAWVRRAAQISVASSARRSVQTAMYRPPPNATTGAAWGPSARRDTGSDTARGRLALTAAEAGAAGMPRATTAANQTAVEARSTRCIGSPGSSSAARSPR